MNPLCLWTLNIRNSSTTLLIFNWPCFFATLTPDCNNVRNTFKHPIVFIIYIHLPSKTAISLRTEKTTDSSLSAAQHFTRCTACISPMSNNGQMLRVSSPFPHSIKKPTIAITLKPLWAYYRKSLTYKLVLFQKGCMTQKPINHLWRY